MLEFYIESAALLIDFFLSAFGGIFSIFLQNCKFFK